MAALQASSITALTRQQRAWVALYSVAAGDKPLPQILEENDVTEADLREHEESWRTMRARRQQHPSRLALAASA
ncbi:hypothetical protein LRS06_20215 [Hymenobacter sp. J193]|uniref:hypothetical protein n=1 Tax=Hymenobacter sp. J193 TaxID=2898429 RepID=UPI002151D85C|nr:hypothetical protein [Hymenobacter sp. J193]MCR5890055.1 hypothetical protein [Hymenobacter sp. J193]